MIEGKLGLDESLLFKIELIIHYSYSGKVLSTLIFCGVDDCNNLIAQ